MGRKFRIQNNKVIMSAEDQKALGMVPVSQDIYMYVGANIPGWGDVFRRAGYDPDNPTGEGVALAKKLCKAERAVCKTVVLACQYGAGVNKVVESLEKDEIFLPREEVEAIHSGYWDVFSQVRDLQRELYLQWRRNGGYILNGMGRPMAVPQGMEKDLLSRFIQSTGHDILVKYVSILTSELDSNRVSWAPIIADLHDATTLEFPDEVPRDRAVGIFNRSMDILNAQLGGVVRMRGTPTVGTNLAEIKEAES